MSNQKRLNIKYVTFISFVAALGGLLFGYDTAVISGTVVRGQAMSVATLSLWVGHIPHRAAHTLNAGNTLSCRDFLPVCLNVCALHADCVETDAENCRQIAGRYRTILAE